MPRKGGKRKKTRTQPLEAPEGAKLPDEVVENVPRSIVARIDKVSVPVKDLVLEMRKVMGPYTATNLKERSYNRMKDYEAVAGNLNVSHLLFFSQTENNINFRIAKHPNGPTLHFRVSKFMLQRQVKACQKRPFESLAAYQTPPVLVLNNFSSAEENQVKLMKITFQNMFRTINVKTVKLSDCRRVVLFHYHKDSGLVEMRHYAIRANPVGISRNMKKIIQSKIPNLGSLEDISQFLDGSAATGAVFGGAVSDSEAEDEGSRVTLPDRYVGRGNAKSQLSAMKLTELGPRLTLELYKVEQGLNEGDILYHKHFQKTPEEAAANKARVEKRKRLKEERKKIQEQNVKRKREQLEEKRKAKAERKKQRLEDGSAAPSGGDDDEDEDEENDSDNDNDGAGDGDEGEDDEGMYSDDYDGEEEVEDSNDEREQEMEQEEEEDDDEDGDDDESDDDNEDDD